DNKPIAAAIDGDEKTGWAVGPRTHERHAALFNFADQLRLGASAKLRVTLSQQAGEVLTLRRFRLSTSAADPAALRPRVDAQEVRRLRDDLAGAYQAQKNFNENVVRLPLMRELPADKRRKTNIHLRGAFLDPGDPVTPGVPAAFHQFPDGAPLN